MSKTKLFNDDCFNVLPHLKEKTIDMILCDLPYGMTHNKWDSVLDLEQLWKQYKKIIKDNGAIVLFGSNKFTMEVMASNKSWHRYNLIWNKENPVGFLNANRMPLTVHEDIMVFYKKLPTYNPQKFEGKAPSHRRTKKGTKLDEMPKVNGNYGDYYIGDYTNEICENNLKFPTSILNFKRIAPCKAVHPTQKPVELCEWLIKTYTNENEVVLDNCMGSGTTGVACKNTNRNFIGIEKEKEYFEIAKRRIENEGNI